MTSTTVEQRTECGALVSDLEDLWQCLDAIMDPLDPADWQRRHGKDWVFADVPYHLSYFDRDVVARALEAGVDIPLVDRWLMQSEVEIDAWNAAEFARRPAGATVAQSIQQMRASRDEVRRVVSSLTDAELDRPAWSPFVGMVTARDVILTGIAHTWSHLTELRNRLKRQTPAPALSATRRATEFYVNFLPATLDRQAATVPFSLVMEFPDVGIWTILVQGGQAMLKDGRAAQADLIMTQTPETFSGVMTKVYNPVVAMLTRKIRVTGVRNMGRFGKLFPNPKPDQLLFPRPDGYESVRIYKN